MNREEFINELKIKLKRLPQEEFDEAINYYEEYFEEAGPENEQRVMGEIGSPTQIAKQIMADFVIKETQIQTRIPSPKKSLSAVWIIIIAIFASPIAFPLAITLVALLFSVVVTIGALILAGCITFIAIGIAGIGVFVIGIGMIFVHPATGVLFVGAGLALVGLALVTGMLVYFATAKLIPLIARGLGKIFDKIRGVK